MTIRNFLCSSTIMISLLCPLAASANEPMPSMEQMWQIIQEQQTQIQRLQKEINTEKTQNIETRDQLQSTQDNIEVIADAVETGTNAQEGWWNHTSIGGYGELHYQGGAKDQIDLHRFVLFVGHEFTDKVRFFSELELEHAIAGAGKVGEIELEQAYIEADLGQNTQIFGGVHLVPVGLINETHEPPTFYGVERNAVEKNIIPATWWEGGIGARGNIGDSGFSWDVMVSSGLDLNAGNGYKIRAGRNKVGKAKFKSEAYSARIGYSGIAGVNLAASLYHQPDITQGAGDSRTGQSVPATLITASADAKYKGFGLRALVSHWNLDGADVRFSGRNKQSGFYLEPSYAFSLPLDGVFPDAKMGVFYRYSNWDNNAGIKNQSGTRRNVVGANFWPIEDVVLKIDYVFEQKQSGGPAKKALNLGIGYQF